MAKTIKQLQNDVIAAAETIEPGHGELPSVQCGKTGEGIECQAFIRVAGGTDAPVSDSWEGALANLVAHLSGDEASLDTSKERLRLQRIKRKAEADITKADSDLAELDAR